MAGLGTRDMLVVMPNAATTPADVPQGRHKLKGGIHEGQNRDPVTGKLLPKKLRILTSDVVEDWEAMEYVATHRPEEDLTYQHKFMREVRDQDPKGFLDRLRSMKPAAAGAGPSVVVCPVCAAAAEPEDVELLIDELLAEESDDAPV